MNFPKLIQVKSLGKYKIWLEYSDNTKGEIDLSDLAGKGIFQTWEVENSFDKVYVEPETGAIAWSEMLDICPDTQYLKIKKMSFEEWKTQNVLYATN